MKRTTEQIEQAKDIITDYLQQSGNNPHQAYDNYIKDHLLAGKMLPSFIQGLREFIKYSKPEQQPKKYNRHNHNNSSIIMDAEQVTSEVKRSIKVYNDCMKYYQNEKPNKYMYEHNNSSREALKILLAKITGTEYIYSDNIE